MPAPVRSPGSRRTFASTRSWPWHRRAGTGFSTSAPRSCDDRRDVARPAVRARARRKRRTARWIGAGRRLMAALALICLPLALLCLGVPIFAALTAAAAVGIIGLGIGSIEPVHVALFGGLDNFPLLAVPLFIFAGEMMGRGGIARRLVEWVLAVVGGVRGSLALATVASSELFGSMSGSSVGCVAAIGRLMIPELTKRGYTAVFSGSLIASCGAIATIIPPSITMIIYGVAAQESVPKLFLAGIVPGLLIGVLVAAYLLVYARVQMIPLTAATRWRNILTTTKEAV